MKQSDLKKLSAAIDKYLQGSYNDGYDTAKREYKEKLLDSEAQCDKYEAALKAVKLDCQEAGDYGLAYETISEALANEQEGET